MLSMVLTKQYPWLRVMPACCARINHIPYRWHMDYCRRRLVKVVHLLAGLSKYTSTINLNVLLPLIGFAMAKRTNIKIPYCECSGHHTMGTCDTLYSCNTSVCIKFCGQRLNFTSLISSRTKNICWAWFLPRCTVPHPKYCRVQLLLIERPVSLAGHPYYNV